jgi:hypothetical protein
VRRSSSDESRRTGAGIGRAIFYTQFTKDRLDIQHIPMLRERNVRTGFFERDQITRIVAHPPMAIRPAVQLAYITGWRMPSEVLPLQWHVDFEARVVCLDPHTTKND